MSICKPSDRQSSSYRGWRATISAVLKLLFALFYYSSTILLIILPIICIKRKTQMMLQVIIYCGNSPWRLPEVLNKQETIIVMEFILNHPPASPVQWMGPLPPPRAARHMPVLPWCTYVNHRTWLDETEGPTSQPPGRWWQACSSTCDLQDPIP